MYKTVLFDLDGTLTNPKEGITKCVQYALEYFGIYEPDLDRLTKFIGPPLHKGFMELRGFSEEDALIAVKKYRERYSETGIFENELYDDTVIVLKSLKEKGIKLSIASSKPEVFVKKIAEHYGILEYFDETVGSELDGGRSDKAEVIAESLRRCGVEDLSEAVMVGDRKHDMEGAKKCGIDCIGVTFGFGSYEELYESGADYTASSLKDAEQIILKGKA